MNGIYNFLCNILNDTGILCRPVPLEECRIIKPYLLQKQGIEPSCGTAFMLAVPYLIPQEAQNRERNLSLYAISRDYHLFFEELSKEILPLLRQHYPSAHFGLFADHSPIDEVDAAGRARLGVKGKNGMLITEEYGSFVFLGEIITDAKIEIDHKGYIPKGQPIPECLNCDRCALSCPSGCIGQDKSECLSSLTQKKGELGNEEYKKINAHKLVWGCDTCQLVCPHNASVLSSKISYAVDFFKEGVISRLSEQIIDAMSDSEFSKRAYSWRGKDVIKRNLMLHIDKEKEDK